MGELTTGSNFEHEVYSLMPFNGVRGIDYSVLLVQKYDKMNILSRNISNQFELSNQFKSSPTITAIPIPNSYEENNFEVEGNKVFTYFPIIKINIFIITYYI